MDYIIRKMKRDDSKDVAHVVTIAWNEAYKGIVSDNDLEELYKNEDERAKKTYDYFDENNNHKYVLEVDGEVVGFVHYGIAKDEEFENCGEIIALYIIAKYKGNGFGRKLVETAIKDLKQDNCDKMIIACLKGNPSNEFYKHIGGKYIKDGMYERLQLPENIYYYDI